MDALERIGQIIGPTIEGMGYDLVRVHLTGGQRPTLQIMAERQDDAPMTVDDCADISRAVSAVLDVEDPLPGAYTLEVSSPGIDRPLTRGKDYVRFAGLVVRVETMLPVNGRKRFQGRLLGLEDGIVRIALEAPEPKDKRPGKAPKEPPPAEVAEVPYDMIQRGKLVLNDELLKMAAEAQADAAPGTEGGEMDVEDRKPRKGPGRFARKG